MVALSSLNREPRSTSETKSSATLVVALKEFRDVTVPCRTQRSGSSHKPLKMDKSPGRVFAPTLQSKALPQRLASTRFASRLRGE